MVASFAPFTAAAGQTLSNHLIRREMINLSSSGNAISRGQVVITERDLATG